MTEPDAQRRLIDDTDSSPTYTVDDALDKIAKNGGLSPMQWRVALFLFLITFYFGWSTTWLPLVLGYAHCSFGLPYWQAMLLPMMWQIGRGLGGMWIGYLCDRFGRKAAISVGIGFSSYCLFLITFAPTFYWALILHFLGGAVVGSTFTQMFGFGAELFASKHKNVVLTLIQIGESIGTGSYLVIQIILTKYKITWRMGACLSVLPAALTILMSFFVTESPHYFITHGQPRKAAQALLKLANGDRTYLPDGRLVPARQSQRLAKESMHKNWLLMMVTPIKMFFVTTALLLTAFLLNSCMHGFQYLAISLLKTYSHEHKGSADGCPPFTSRTFTDMMFLQLAGGLSLGLSTLEFKLAGQRVLMFTNGAMAALCFGCLLLPLSRTLATVVLFFARLFCGSACDVINIYTPNFFPSFIRGKAMSLVTAVGILGTIAAPYACQVLVIQHTTVAKVVFLLAALFFWLFSSLLPDTGGRKLESGLLDE